MKNLLQKYNSLEPDSQILIMKFIDFLEHGEQRDKNFNEDYKKRIKKVSVWSDEDLEIYDEVRKEFQKWNINGW